MQSAFFNPFTGFVYDPEAEAARNDQRRFETQMQSAVARDQINAANRQNQSNNDLRRYDINARQAESMARESGLNTRNSEDLTFRREALKQARELGLSEMEAKKYIADKQAERDAAVLSLRNAERPLDTLRRDQELQRFIETAAEEDAMDNQIANVAQRVEAINGALSEFKNANKLIENMPWFGKSPEQVEAKQKIAELSKQGFNPATLEAERKDLISQIASLGARVDMNAGKILGGIPRTTPREWRNVLGKLQPQRQGPQYNELGELIETQTEVVPFRIPQNQPIQIPRAWGATPGFNGNIGLPTMGSGLLNGGAATGSRFTVSPDGRLVPVQ